MLPYTAVSTRRGDLIILPRGCLPEASSCACSWLLPGTAVHNCAPRVAIDDAPECLGVRTNCVQAAGGREGAIALEGHSVDAAAVALLLQQAVPGL